MADITNAEAVRYSNEQLRVAANLFNEAYRKSKSALAEWVANPGMFPNTEDTIIDGAETDGRHIVNGIKANNVYNRMSEFVTDYEANSSAKLNTILQYATNEPV